MFITTDKNVPDVLSSVNPSNVFQMTGNSRESKPDNFTAAEIQSAAHIARRFTYSLTGERLSASWLRYLFPFVDFTAERCEHVTLGQLEPPIR